MGGGGGGEGELATSEESALVGCGVRGNAVFGSPTPCMPRGPDDERHFFSTRTRNVSGGKLRRRRMVMGKERKRRSSRKNERGESVRTLISGGRILKKIREMAPEHAGDCPEEPLHADGVLRRPGCFLAA